MNILEIYPEALEPEFLEQVEELISENNLPFAWEESFDGKVACFKVYSFGIYPLRELKIQCEERFSSCEYLWKEMDSESWSSGWSEDEVLHWKSDSFDVFVGEENLSQASGSAIVLGRSPHVFGDGQHTSTILMLNAMETQLKRNQPQRALDFGAGSGILAIAAHKLGVSCVDACEVDENALRVAKQNCEWNECSGVSLYQYLPEDLCYDFIMCNVQPPLLNTLLPDLSKRLEPGGTVILSGYTTLDKRGIAVAMEQLGFLHVTDCENKGWLATVWLKSG